MASLALASEKARSSACGLEARGESLRRAVWKPHLVGKIPDRPRQFGTGVYLLHDAEQVWSCSGPLRCLVGGGGTQQEGLKDKTPI